MIRMSMLTGSELVAFGGVASAQTTTPAPTSHNVTTRHVVVTKKTTVVTHGVRPVAHSISYGRAQQIALNARPGRVVSHRMDRERGGPAYSFDIRNARGRYEVDVNQRTGAVVENRLKARV